VLVATALALLVSPTSAAHVIPSPAFVESGSSATIELAGPNERDEPMTGFAVLAPEGIRIVRAEPEAPWSVVETGPSQAAWAGGSLAPDEEVTFRVEIEATAPPGPVALEAEQRYPGGEVVRWDVPLTVVPGAEEQGQNLAAALAVGAVGLLVIAAIALVAARRRSRSLPEDGA
jgi:uncharacterized protein YcnI